MIKLTSDLSSQIMQAKKDWIEIFKVVKEKNPPTYNSVSSKTILQKWSNKDFLRQIKTEGICHQSTALHGVLKEILQREGK